MPPQQVEGRSDLFDCCGDFVFHLRGGLDLDGAVVEMRGHVVQELDHVRAFAGQQRVVHGRAIARPGRARRGHDRLRGFGARDVPAGSEVDFREQLDRVADECHRLAGHDEARDDALGMRVGRKFLDAARAGQNHEAVEIRAERLADRHVDGEVEAPGVVVPAVDEAGFRADSFHDRTGFRHFAHDNRHYRLIHAVGDEDHDFFALELCQIVVSLCY